MICTKDYWLCDLNACMYLCMYVYYHFWKHSYHFSFAQVFWKIKNKKTNQNFVWGNHDILLQGVYSAVSDTAL